MPEKTVKRRPQDCDAALASDDGRRLYESSEGQTRASAPLLSPAGCWVTDRKNENCCRGEAETDEDNYITARAGAGDRTHTSRMGRKLRANPRDRCIATDDPRLKEK